MTHSAELKQVLSQARDIASQTEQAPSSAHVLLAMFTVPNLAELLLLEREVNEETLLALIERMEPEPRDTLDRLQALAAAIARGCESSKVNCLHLLAAITQLEDTFAHGLLRRTELAVEALQREALEYAAHGVPSRLLASERALEQPPDARPSTVTLEYAAVPRDTERDLPPVDDPSMVVEVHRHTAQVPTLRAAVGAADKRRNPGRRASDHWDGSEDRRRRDRRSEFDVDGPFALDPDEFPWLTQLGRNLSQAAHEGLLDPVLDRDEEIEQTIDILNKRRSNNPCLLGDPGVGKTAIAEGVASRWVADQNPRLIIQVDVGGIVAGTHLRGALAERLRGLQEEVRRASGRVVVFIDELHTLMGAGGGDGGHDASNELKAALARGDFPCIGATTPGEYRTHIEADPAMERRFTAVHVEEPDPAATLRIIEGVADRYSEHHGVEYLPEALEAAVRFSRRYIHDRCDPDKSLGILDHAGAVARRHGSAVDRRAVAEVVARVARVPLEHLLVDDPARFLQMESTLAERIVGQRHVLEAVSETVRRNLAGFAGRRPVGSFLFLGPTGVGKTEVVKVLAEFLFGSQRAMTRFDMSEYSESHTVARLVGSPPGYVGHEEGGQLTESVRKRPYQVVLFDEIEKGHRDVWNVLLQVLDDGRVTDGRGRTVDCTNIVVVLTSNLGAEAWDGPSRRIGFADEGPAGAQDEAALAGARAAFPPELWNRIERRLVFRPLDRAQVRAVAERLLAERSRLLADDRGIDFVVTPAGIEHLIENGGFDPSLGARPMRQTIARLVEGPLAQRILAAELDRGDHVVVDARDGRLRFTAR